jgi:hypothetical protein
LLGIADFTFISDTRNFRLTLLLHSPIVKLGEENQDLQRFGLSKVFCNSRSQVKDDRGKYYDLYFVTFCSIIHLLKMYYDVLIMNKKLQCDAIHTKIQKRETFSQAVYNLEKERSKETDYSNVT